MSIKQTKIMGILNVTPDSFSGDGLFSKKDPVISAVKQASNFINNGALILDIGAESTRPGANVVLENEELKRVIPVIKAIRNNHPEILISIDTYKANVAEKAILSGANWINDIWGFRADPDLAKVASKYKVFSVLMHNRSKPVDSEISDNLGGRYVNIEYHDLITEVKHDLLESIDIALTAGVAREKIILDPGIGFGKTVEQNLELINRIDEIKMLGYPILFGPSRKSFIGYTLNLPITDRLEGTIAAVVLGIIRGADFVRVHDVAQISRAVKMTDAMLSIKK